MSVTKMINGVRHIRRKGYTRKDGVRVKASWVPDKGAPGRTPKSKRVLPKLEKGGLGKFGYKVKNNELSRHRALCKAIRAEGKNPVLRKVVVLRSYNKRTKYYSRLNKDVKYVQSKK